MEITKDNFKNIFSIIDSNIAIIDGANNKNIQRALQKLKDKVKETEDGGEQLIKDNNVLKIGIVGQVKAGKSSFLNSLFFDGENILPRASTPMTAGLTVLAYGEENSFTVEYYNTKEWDTFKTKDKEYQTIIQEYRAENPNLSEDDIINQFNIDSEVRTAHELVSTCSRNALNNIKETSRKDTRDFSNIMDLQNILENYVGAKGQYTPIVKCLTIKLHDERLKDIEIVDTPGVNDPVVSREQRTREFLRSCHGVFFLSYSGRFFDSTDTSFLSERIGSQGIGTIVLIASKFDSVLQDVGMKFRDNLSDAIDDCQKKLKKQYRTNIATTDYSGKDPIVDFSSGIGFSIYKKPQDRWDDIEQHVVKQMQHFYPSFFSDEKSIKETFYALSQMDEIRTNYLEGTFKKNKDSIISEKTRAYFSQASKVLKKMVEGQNEDLTAKLDYLQSSDISQMEDKKNKYNNILNQIKSGLDTISITMDSRVDRYVKETLNKFSLNVSLPTKPTEGSFKRKSTSILRRNKDFTCTYEAVDVNRLTDNLKQAINKEIEKINNIWSEKQNEIRQYIREEISKIITENEKTDTTGVINSIILRNILTQTIEELNNATTISYKEIKDNDIDSLFQGIGLMTRYYGSMDVSEAISKIKNEARKQIDEARTKLNNQISAIQENVEKVLHKSANDSIDIVTEKKSIFLDKLSRNIDETLKALEEELKNKKEEEQNYTKVINELTQIEQTL